MHVIIPNQRILNVTEDHWTRRNSGSDRIRDTIRQWISRRFRVGRNFTRAILCKTLCKSPIDLCDCSASLDPLKYMAEIIIIRVEKGIGGRRINRIHGLHNLKLSFHASHAYVRNEIKEENIWRLINNVCHQRCYCQLQIFLKTLPSFILSLQKSRILFHPLPPKTSSKFKNSWRSQEKFSQKKAQEEKLVSATLEFPFIPPST